MAWTHGTWTQDDNIHDGYIFVNTSEPATFSVSGIANMFSLDDDIYGGIPYVNTAPRPRAFNAGEFGFWEFGEYHGGYPHIKTSRTDPLGAFNFTPNLTTITIPSCVRNIDEHSFTHSGLTNAHLPSTCIYKETSFPPNCEIIIDPTSE